MSYLHLKTTGGTSLDKDKDQKQSWFTIQEAFQNFVASCMDPIERFRAQRLLRRLHGLLVIFQTREPEQWISAAESIMEWLNTNRDWSFFDIGEREQGSVRDEGEEEDRRSDESVDPQDRYDYE